MRQKATTKITKILLIVAVVVGVIYMYNMYRIGIDFILAFDANSIYLSF